MSNELKTKPTQNSVRDLRNMGIRPDALVCRVPFETNDSIKNSTLNDSLRSGKVNRITLNKYKDIFCCEPKVGRRKSTFSKYNDIKISKLSTKLHSDLSKYYLKTESSFKQSKV